MYEDINRFFKNALYDPKKGMLNEGFNDEVDLSGWVNIGEIPYYSDTLYIFIDPNYANVDVPEWRFKDTVIKLTPNKDGSGRQTTLGDIPVFYRQKFSLYPQYKDSEYADVLIGVKKKPTEQLEEEHNEIWSQLFRIGDNVCIHHNSSVKITDGVIKKGKANNWSNNSDVGIYFWGSRNDGRDPSGNSLYTYYCLISENDIYDKYSNPQRLNVDQALSQYKYVADFWHNKEAVLIRAGAETPIWRILNKQTGEWFDSKWNKVDRPF